MPLSGVQGSMLNRFLLAAALAFTHPAFAQDLSPALERELDRLYGPPAQPARWRYREPEDKLDYLLRVAQVEKKRWPEGELTYVMLVGEQEKAEEKFPPHMALVAFLVLNQRDGNEELMASSRLPARVFGQAPPRAKLAQFAPGYYWGWLVESEGAFRGNAWTEWTIHLPHASGIVRSATIPRHHTNAAAGLCRPGAARQCTHLRWTLRIDDASAGEKTWPLVIERSGVRYGRKLKPATFRIPFDENAWRYRVPKLD